MNKTHKFIALAIFVLQCWAVQSELSGYIALDSRAFLNKAVHEGQKQGTGVSVIFEPELVMGETEKIKAVPFVQWDSVDSKRTHQDVRELYYLLERDKFEILAGYSRVFWGVTESRHLVNIINQIDTVVDVDEEDYLGQPMFMFARFTDLGTFRAFVMPYFRTRDYAGRSGRLRGPLLVADRANFQSPAGRRHVDLALRYTKVNGDWDIGLAYFRGTSREPNLIQEGNELVPYYQQIHQYSTDIQVTKNAFLGKYEGIYRTDSVRNFYAHVTGLEYTLYNIGEGSDFGFVLEHLLDNRSPGAPTTLFENHLFTGGRVTFNDVADSAILAGGIWSLNYGSWSFQVEAERRLFKSLKLEFSARWSTNVGVNDPLYSFRNDAHLKLQLSQYF